MLSPFLELREAPFGGLGIYAVGNISAGSCVWWEDKESDPPLYTFSRRQVVEHPQREVLARYSWMVGPDTYGSTLDPLEDPAYFLNHSCDGNCWYDGDKKLVAKRDILADEHVAYDYALTETEASLHAGMKCKCGSAICRGVLHFSQYRDPEWVKQNEGHMYSYIARKVKETGWHHPAVHPMRFGAPPLPPVVVGVAPPSGSGTNSNADTAADLCSFLGPAATPRTATNGTGGSDLMSSGDVGSASIIDGCCSSGSGRSSERGGGSDGAEASAGGLGLVALRPLSKGEVVVFWGGKIVGRDEFLKTQRLRPTLHFNQVAPSLWMVPTADGPETPDYINHSCEPNCGLIDSLTIVAMRDIDEGEELTFDYGTCMDEAIEDTGLETFECLCGAPTCRGLVTPRDYLRPSVQSRCRGYFPPFLAAKLASDRDRAAAASCQQLSC